MSVATDYYKLNTGLIKKFKRFIHSDFISQVNADSASNRVMQWKPAEFPYTHYYAWYTQDFFNVSKSVRFFKFLEKSPSVMTSLQNLQHLLKQMQ